MEPELQRSKEHGALLLVILNTNKELKCGKRSEVPAGQRLLEDASWLVFRFSI